MQPGRPIICLRKHIHIPLIATGTSYLGTDSCWSPNLKDREDAFGDYSSATIHSELYCRWTRVIWAHCDWAAKEKSQKSFTLTSLVYSKRWIWFLTQVSSSSQKIRKPQNCAECLLARLLVKVVINSYLHIIAHL